VYARPGLDWRIFSGRKVSLGLHAARPLVPELREYGHGQEIWTAAMLWCVERSMKGLRAMLGTDIEDENAHTEAYVFCPACADWEFGPPRADHKELSP
jgi:hypothetical protein